MTRDGGRTASALQRRYVVVRVQQVTRRAIATRRQWRSTSRVVMFNFAAFVAMI